jgi:hypothetical protein
MSAQGISRNDVPRSLGGTCLIVTAVTLIAMLLTHRWIVDTREERRSLALAQQEAEAERRKYFALQAALESEMGRLTRDMNADRHRIATTLVTEREKMHADFEERRLQVTTEAFRTGVQMERAGMLRPDEPVMPANLIRFPGQGQPSQSEQHARSREHGVVGP